MKERLLVTGGAGYLGSVMVPELLRLGHPVTVLDSFRYGQSTLLECCADPRFQVIRADARDEATMRSCLAEADVILPLAALVGAPLCQRDPAGAWSTNRDAIALLARLASPAQRIILPSTNSGYGIGIPGVPCTEDSPLKPISIYGRSKVEAERIVLERGNAVTLRLATVFGLSPRMRLDLLVNDFTHRAVRDRALVVFEGHFKRNFLHIRDVARAFAHVLEHFEGMRDRPYNVGLSDANLSKLELCARIAGHVPGFVYLEAPVGEDPDKRDYIVSNGRIEATGFTPTWSLDDGIRELVKGFAIVGDGAFRNA